MGKQKYPGKLRGCEQILYTIPAIKGLVSGLPAGSRKRFVVFYQCGFLEIYQHQKSDSIPKMNKSQKTCPS
jgi:hypothetical protein